jgi:flagellar hook-length control protein FliK
VARLHLQPRELGDVVVHIRTSGERIEVFVQAERAEAVQLIRDQANALAGLLGDRGLNLADLNVGLGLQQQGRQWAGPEQQPDNERNGASSFDAALKGDVVEANNRTHRQLRATYNPDGAHSYRV